MEGRLALGTVHVTLEFDGGDGDREQIAHLYRVGRILRHVSADGRVSIEAEVPRRILIDSVRSGLPSCTVDGAVRVNGSSFFVLRSSSLVLRSVLRVLIVFFVCLVPLRLVSRSCVTVIAVMTCGAGACAAKKIRRAPAGARRAEYPDFVFPAAPARLAPPAVRHQVAWQWLQAGDLRAAERNFGAALKEAPAFYPSEAGLGYVRSRETTTSRRPSHFERALTANPALRAGARRARRSAA